MRASKFTKETIDSYGMIERNFPQFSVGDTIAISVKIIEGEKERIQVFQGDVISMRSHGISSTFTVRKASVNSVFVERIFPYYSPIISEIAIVRKGKVRRAKLYYIRDRVGRAARITEDIQTKEQKLARAGKLVAHAAMPVSSVEDQAVAAVTEVAPDESAE